jgi:hypothetical protein
MGLYITLKVSARKKTPHKEMVKPKSNQTSFKRVITFLPKKALRVVRKAHHHAITKPHTHLMNKGKVYATWHTKKHHHKVHLGIASVWAMIAIVGALGLTNIAKAYDTFTQSDWSGGVGSSTTDQYLYKDNIVVSNAGELSLDSTVISNWCSTANCDNNWTKRKKIEISNQGVERTDYQVEFTVFDTGADMDPYFHTLRFTNEAGDTDLPFTFRNVNADVSAKVMVKLPILYGATTTSVYVYYGNLTAGSAENSNAVYDWYDTFNGSAGQLDPAKWQDVATAEANGVTLDGSDNLTADGSTASGIELMPVNNAIDRSDPAVYEIRHLGVQAIGNNATCNVDNQSWFGPKVVGSDGPDQDDYGITFGCNEGQNTYTISAYSAAGGNSWAGSYPVPLSDRNFGSGGFGYKVGLSGGAPVLQYSTSGGFSGADWTDFESSVYQIGSVPSLNFFIAARPGSQFTIDSMYRYKAGANYGANVGLEESIGGSVGTISSAAFDLGGVDLESWAIGAVHLTTSGSGGRAALKVYRSYGAAGPSDFLYCPIALDGETPSTGTADCLLNGHGDGATYLYYQVVMSGDAGNDFKVEEVSLDYLLDVTPPTNPTAVTMTEGPGGQAISNGSFTNLRTLPSELGGQVGKPYFEWSGAADNVGGAGVLGYCIYFGTDNSADPLTSKGAITDASPLNTNGTCPYAITGTTLDFASITTSIDLTRFANNDANYYLRIRTLDAVYNPSVDTEQFEFKLDTTYPGLFSPVISTATRQGPEVEINWATTLGGMMALPTDNASEVFGGPPSNPSGVAGIAWCSSDVAGAFSGHCDLNAPVWHGANGSAAGSFLDMINGNFTFADASAGQLIADLSEEPTTDYNGPNSIYIVVFDNAGNFTNMPSAAFNPGNNKFIIFNNTPPSAPQNLVATPTTNTANSFAFSWDAPSDLVGLAQNANYCWSANVLPDANNCTFAGVGVESLSADAYATQPGLNTMYVVARDEAGNIDYANYASTTFTANTSAPGAPRNLEVIDASNKATSTWKLALSWDVPLLAGSGVDKYKIFRSVDDITYTEIGSTTATSFVDAGLSQVEYYYKIKACDNANNCGLYSDMDSLLPTGRYTDPANLVSGPQVVDIKTRSARIQWSTDRVSDTKVAYGTSSNNYQAAQAYQAAQVTSHSIELSNLQPGTTYYYRARWTDDDGNTGQSAELQFKTQPAPVVSDAAISNINLNSATLGFTTQAATRAKIYYGTSTAFGSLTTVNTSTDLSSYTTQLTDLADGTKYFYRINTVDSSGYEYDGSVASFTTIARPRISNLRFQTVEGEPSSTQKITWTTNVPASSEVVFGPVGLPQATVSEGGELRTEHEVTVRELLDDTTYSLIARSRDALGNVAVSDPQEFRTALDTRPPKAFDINTESSIRGTGAEARGQIIVTWKTDEPSTSQVSYGVGAGSSATTKTAEDARLTTDHIVIISDLSTSSVYNVQAISADKAGNKVVSTDQSVVVGRGTDNIFSIIFGALQKIFGVEL